MRRSVRVGAGPQDEPVDRWLKTIGRAGWSLPDEWLHAADGFPWLSETGFPRRPRIRAGDRLVLYAAGWKRIFAVVEATGDPFAADHPRWPWRISVEPLLLVPVLSNAPRVEACGVTPRSLSQHSHIRLPAEHYERAVAAIASIAEAG